MRKNIKILDVMNVLFACLALILEIMPKSVIRGTYAREWEEITWTTSYFVSPFSGDGFISLTIAVMTNLIVLLSIINLIKNYKAVEIICIVLSSLAFAVSFLWLVLTRRGTAYNIVVTLLSFALIVTYSIKCKASYSKGEISQIRSK